MSDTVQIKPPTAASIMVLLTILGAAAGGIATYSAQVALGSRFEKDTNAHFEQIEKDRDIRTAVANKRMDEITAQIGTRFESLDKRDETRTERITGVDSRLIRIESKLDYYLQTNVNGKPRP